MDKSNLLKAINLAEGHGECMYLSDDDTPRCVIAQLYILEGGTIAEMKRWEARNVVNVLAKFSVPELEKYDTNLLYRLQNIWDKRIYRGYQAKNLMKKAVYDVY